MSSYTNVCASRLTICYAPFMDNQCRWLESVYDSKLFAKSSSSMKMRKGALALPQNFQNLFPGSEKISNYLIGDPTYCIKECNHCSNNGLVVFNMLRSARNPIECAFGRMKDSWEYFLEICT